MLLVLSSSMLRRTLLLAAVVLAAVLSFFAFRFAAAEYFSSLGTFAGLEKAARLEPGNARHWYLLGRYWQFNLDQQDFPRAIELYRHSLLLNPRDPAVWLDLASAHEALGDLSSARSALLSAKKSHPVSAEVAWRYGNFLLRQGELDSAFAEIHSSLQSEPLRTPEAVSVCWSANPDSQVLLAQVLPPSQEVYIPALRTLAADGAVDASLEVWKRLAALHPHLPLRDASPFLNLLLSTAHGSDAAQAWKQALEFAEIPDPGGPPGSLLWDGGFESNVREGLSWRIQEEKGVLIGYDGAVKHSGAQSLRIHFDGSRNLAFSAACQIVPVTPLTSYQFSGWMRSESISTDRGIFAALSARGSPTLSSPELRATEPWTQWTLSWQAGKDSNVAQICIGRTASQKFDNKIAGTAWVDDLALVPLPAAPPPAKARP
jgi:hypothetical protein